MELDLSLNDKGSRGEEIERIHGRESSREKR